MRGFLIYGKNQAKQAVKKIHLGMASSGYCPCPHRVPTVSPPFPHAWGWLAGESILNIEKSLGPGRSLLSTGGPNRAFACSVPRRTAKNHPPRLVICWSFDVGSEIAKVPCRVPE